MRKGGVGGEVLCIHRMADGWYLALTIWSPKVVSRMSAPKGTPSQGERAPPQAAQFRTHKTTCDGM